MRSAYSSLILLICVLAALSTLLWIESSVPTAVEFSALSEGESRGSQNGEDKIIYAEYFLGKRRGTFIEIGAHVHARATHGLDRPPH